MADRLLQLALAVDAGLDARNSPLAFWGNRLVADGAALGAGLDPPGAAGVRRKRVVAQRLLTVGGEVGKVAHAAARPPEGGMRPLGGQRTK